MNFKNILFVLRLTVFLVSCANDKKKEEPDTVTVESGNDVTSKQAESNTASVIEFNDEKKKAVFKSYLQLKDALVSTDAAKAAASASRLMTAFANLGVDDATLKAAQNIVEAKNIEAQRTAFVAVTTSVEALMADALANGTIYKQYCPMAFNNTGASWLSDSSEIFNPYFGSKMLKCGRVDAKIESF